MENKDNFEPTLSVTLTGTSTVNISFSVPSGLEPYLLSCKNTDLAIEYYLLARYAYLHKMFPAFMINSFWAVEHLILSILVLDLKDKDRLKQIGGFHAITKYWETAKTIVPREMVGGMKQFDCYIGKVQGYFAERYPEISDNGKLLHSGRTPKVSTGSERGRRVNFGKVAQLNLDEIDHFVSFMLHDITTYREGCSTNLMIKLEMNDNTALYLADNNYSLIYPNKKYPAAKKQ